MEISYAAATQTRIRQSVSAGGRKRTLGDVAGKRLVESEPGRVKYITITGLALVLAAAAPGAGAAAPAKQIVLPDGLKYTDTVVGRGPVAKAGETVHVHYVGTLTNGTKFDSSRDRNQPFTFPLGGGQVIRGWDEGVAGMRVGGKRRLVIPPQLGYGSAGAGGVIPPNATLIFEIELLGIDR